MWCVLCLCRHELWVFVDLLARRLLVDLDLALCLLSHAEHAISVLNITSFRSSCEFYWKI